MMVPSQRRHRINGLELGPVKRAICTQLTDYLEARKPRLEAEVLFRVLYRIENPNPGQPDYPDFSWAAVRALVQPERMMVPLKEAPIA